MVLGVDRVFRSTGPPRPLPGRGRGTINASLLDEQNTCEKGPPGRRAGRWARGGGELVGADRSDGGGRAATPHGGSVCARARRLPEPVRPLFPGPERARSRGPMGDRGLRRAEAGAARLRAVAATGSVMPAGFVQIRGCGPPERGARGGRPLPVVGGGPPRMRGLYRYTLCKRNIQQRARTDRPLVAPSPSGGGARGAGGSR